MISESLFISRIQKPRPDISEIVPVSYPVTSFGDLNKARILTIGINPSIDEFHSRAKGRPVLSVEEKRFEDAESLGVEPGAALNETQARKVLESNNRYFERNPYHWFNMLEKYALEPIGASYFDGSAAHFDLVQWATDPVWSRIKDEETRERLIAEDMGYLAQVLESGEWDLVIAHGREVYQTMRYYKLFKLFELEEPVVSGQKRMFWNGRVASSPMVTFSVNLPVYGTSVQTREFVADWMPRAMNRIGSPEFQDWYQQN